MYRRMPSEEEMAEFKKVMIGMTSARLDVFAANAAKVAEVLGTYRTALQKSGFSAEESMQIVLKAAEQQSRRPMPGWGRGGHWHGD